MSPSSQPSSDRQLNFDLLKEPIYSKDALEELIKHRDEANLKSKAGEAHSFKWLDATGTNVDICLPTEKGISPYGIYVNIQAEVCKNLCDPIVTRPKGPEDVRFRCSMYLRFKAPERTATVSPIKEWIKEWDASDSKKRITAFLEAHCKKMRPVNNVTGIRMGSPLSEHEDDFFQHLAANHIAELIGKAQNKHVDLYIQDFALDEDSKKFFTKQKAALRDDEAGRKNSKNPFMHHFARFRILEDPEAFLKTDHITFVLFFHPRGFDVADVVVDVAGPLGPAGMMCKPIKEDGLEIIQGWRAKEADDKRFRLITTSTPVWKWRSECVGKNIEVKEPWLAHHGEVGLYVRTDK